MIDDAKVQADRMRECVKGCPFPNVYTEMNAGADTIERLQRELAALREQLASLKAELESANRAYADVMRAVDECGSYKP